MQPTSRVTEDEYLARENAATEKHELVNGQIVAMSGAVPRHNALVSNLNAGLRLRLRDKGCRPYASDQRLLVPRTGLYTYPDLLVVCGAPQIHPRDPMTIVNPRMVLEVLSPTTEAYDRGAKFSHYRSIESLRTYVIVSQHEPRVERFERGEGAAWTFHDAVGDDAVLDLPSLEITVPLAEIFADLPAG